MGGLSDVSINSMNGTFARPPSPPFAMGNAPRLMSPRMLSALPPVPRNALTQTLMLKDPLNELGLECPLNGVQELTWTTVDGSENAGDWDETDEAIAALDDDEV